MTINATPVHTAPDPGANTGRTVQLWFPQWNGFVHDLKCWPTHFDGIAAGEKRAEVRLDDREYRVGDVLHLCRWDPDAVTVDAGSQVESLGAYTGAEMRVGVTHVLRASDHPGITAGHVVMSVTQPLDWAAQQRTEREVAS